LPFENPIHYQKAFVELNHFQNSDRSICKYFMPKNDLPGGDNLEKEKPEREY